MKYYIDIKLFNDTEITLGFIWQKVYTQMHLALVELKDENDTVDIGFSFPFYANHQFPMGDVLRVFAESKERLEVLDINRWLNRLEGYAYVGEIKEVPNNVTKYLSFGRKRFKSNAETRRLAKRYAKRNGIPDEEALKMYKKTEEKYAGLIEDNKSSKGESKIPFINIKSLSKGNHLKLFIVKKELEREDKGRFNTYGLSNISTLPNF